MKCALSAQSLCHTATSYNLRRFNVYVRSFRHSWYMSRNMSNIRNSNMFCVCLLRFSCWCPSRVSVYESLRDFGFKLLTTFVGYNLRSLCNFMYMYFAVVHDFSERYIFCFSRPLPVCLSVLQNCTRSTNVLRVSIFGRVWHPFVWFIRTTSVDLTCFIRDTFLNVLRRRQPRFQTFHVNQVWPKFICGINASCM